VRPSGEETLLAEQRDVMARPVDFGDADLKLHDEEGARELVLVQLPGGVTSPMMWVESDPHLRPTCRRGHLSCWKRCHRHQRAPLLGACDHER
jgi:hypothetical protein